MLTELMLKSCWNCGIKVQDTILIRRLKGIILCLIVFLHFGAQTLNPKEKSLLHSVLALYNLFKHQVIMCHTQRAVCMAMPSSVD